LKMQTLSFTEINGCGKPKTTWRKSTSNDQWNGWRSFRKIIRREKFPAEAKAKAEKMIKTSS
jgi:hypothetical protein